MRGRQSEGRGEEVWVAEARHTRVIGREQQDTRKHKQTLRDAYGWGKREMHTILPLLTCCICVEACGLRSLPGSSVRIFFSGNQFPLPPAVAPTPLSKRRLEHSGYRHHINWVPPRLQDPLDKLTGWLTLISFIASLPTSPQRHIKVNQVHMKVNKLLITLNKLHIKVNKLHEKVNKDENIAEL